VISRPSSPFATRVRPGAPLWTHAAMALAAMALAAMALAA